jgi:hypothetical protein
MMIIIILAAMVPLAFLWVGGIDSMKKDHPDYKGEDLFEDFKDEEDKK